MSSILRTSWTPMWSKTPRQCKLWNPMQPIYLGCLNWIVLKTRPDIAWATNRATSMITDDSDTSFIRVRHRGADPTKLDCVPWYHLFTEMGGNLDQWRSSRQDLIAKSTCEAELVSSSELFNKERILPWWWQKWPTDPCEIEVSSDNAASLNMIRNGSETSLARPSYRREALWMHHIAKFAAKRGIKFTYMPTAEMATVTIWIRALAPVNFHKSMNSCSLETESHGQGHSCGLHLLSASCLRIMLFNFSMSQLCNVTSHHLNVSSPPVNCLVCKYYFVLVHNCRHDLGEWRTSLHGSPL